jgi:hypothetical protein
MEWHTKLNSCSHSLASSDTRIPVVDVALPLEKDANCLVLVDSTLPIRLRRWVNWRAVGKATRAHRNELFQLFFRTASYSLERAVPT